MMYTPPVRGRFDLHPIAEVTFARPSGVFTHRNHVNGSVRKLNN